MIFKNIMKFNNLSTLPLFIILALILVDHANASKSNEYGAVYTMTNSTDSTRGNEVVVYKRYYDGSLKYNMSRATRGLGSGPAPTSSVFGTPVPATHDGIGSQDSIVINDRKNKLFVVNSGSNEVSCFPIKRNGDLDRPVTVASGGVFPASVAVNGRTIAVLNAGNAGNITLFRVNKRCEFRQLGSLSLAGLGNGTPFPNPAPNEVLTTAAQVSFTHHGSKLVFSIKGGPDNFGGSIGVVNIRRNGRFDHHSLVVTEAALFNLENGTRGPFGFEFDSNDNLILNQVNDSTLSSYRINDDNSLSPNNDPIQINARGGAGPFLGFAGFNCWVKIARGAAANGDDIAYVMSFGFIPATSGGLPDGPGTIVAVQIDSAGNLSLPSIGLGGEAGLVAVLDQDDITDPDSTLFGNHGIDIEVIDGYLYAVQPRVGIIGFWKINPDTTLTELGSVGGLGKGVDPFIGTNPGINDFTVRCFINRDAPECERQSPQGITGY